MKWMLWTLAIAIGSLVVVVLVGWMLPRDHVATRAAQFHQRPEAIWAAITDVDAMPSWREGLKSVKHLPDRNGLPAHVEVTSSGEIPLETVEMTPPRKLVSRIAGDNLPFGGTWTFEITPDGDGATLRITERGWVSNPIFRFVSRFVLGYTSNLEMYLRSLGRKFGETAQIGA
jgi:uncharacterized protein YndB with AHSA1/START domain